MRIIVPEWFYMKEQDKAGRYGYTLLWRRVYKYHGVSISVEFGNSLVESGDEEVEKIGYCFFGEKLSETEKAVQFSLSYWNLRKAGRYITDAPVEHGWKMWIPKSVILK